MTHTFRSKPFENTLHHCNLGRCEQRRFRYVAAWLHIIFTPDLPIWTHFRSDSFRDVIPPHLHVCSSHPLFFSPGLLLQTTSIAFNTARASLYLFFASWLPSFSPTCLRSFDRLHVSLVIARFLHSTLYVSGQDVSSAFISWLALLKPPKFVHPLRFAFHLIACHPILVALLRYRSFICLFQIFFSFPVKS